MIAHKTMRDLMYDHICQKIRAGEMHASSMIKESVLSQELGVSRTPVREALIQLAGEGILEFIPHKGFLIKPMDEQAVRDMLSVLGVLDGLAATLAIPLLTEKDFVALQNCIDAMDFAIDHGNDDMYLSMQNLFHEIYLQACGNDTLCETIHKLKNRLFKKKYHVEGNEEFLRTLNNEHRHILELLLKKDAQAVRDYLIEVHWPPEAANDEVFI